jgi:hypothetical protein
MLPAEPIEVWMYSTPVKLGEVVAGADGSFSAELLLPADASLGAHKLQIVGKTVDGAEMVFAQGILVVDGTVLTMNRAGALNSATADNLGKDNVVSISTMNKGDAANIMLWFLVIMILVAGLLAAQQRRKSIALSPVQRIEIATPWLAGMRLPRMLMLLVGVLAGFGAANSASFSATAPSTLWVAVLIIVGLLDVMAGGVAGLVFAISVVAGGSVGSMLDIRVTALVVLVATLPNVIGRAARPHGARFAVQSAITAVLNVTVVISLVSLFAPVGGVNYELSAWLVELSWVAALASAGRFALLRITQSSNDHYDAHIPALRVAGVVLNCAAIGAIQIAHALIKTVEFKRGTRVHGQRRCGKDLIASFESDRRSSSSSARSINREVSRNGSRPASFREDQRAAGDDGACGARVGVGGRATQCHAAGAGFDHGKVRSSGEHTVKDRVADGRTKDVPNRHDGGNTGTDGT